MIKRNKKTFKNRNQNDRGNAQELTVRPEIKLSDALQINEAITMEKSNAMNEAEAFLKKHNIVSKVISHAARDLHGIIDPKLTVHDLSKPRPIHFEDALNKALGNQFSDENDEITNYTIKLPTHNRNEYNALIRTIKDYQLDPAMNDSTVLIKFYDTLVEASECKLSDFKFEAKDADEVISILQLFKGHKYPINSTECHMVNKIVMVLNELIKQ